MNEKIISIFVGLTDKVNEGRWVWNSDGSETQYTFWDSGQPNGGEQDCGMMTSRNGKWHDDVCDRLLRTHLAICQNHRLKLLSATF